MVESIDNIIQTAVMLVCTFAAANLAFREKSRAWTFLAFFFASFALDDLYLVLCLLTVGDSATLTVAADLGWYAAFIFLYFLVRQTAPPDGTEKKHFLPWLAPVFTMGMAVFFMQWGEVVSNLIYGMLFGLVMFTAVSRLTGGERYRKQRPLCAAVLLLCFLEYALWTISCFFHEDALTNPYYLADFLITLTFPLFFPVTRKAVEA